MRQGMNLFMVLCLIVVVSGCASISKTAKGQLAKDVDCTTAQDDIQVLEAEKASVGKQIVSGVRSVLPVAAVIGILRRDYKNRVQVATGKYNRDLEAKIKEIKYTCGLE